MKPKMIIVIISILFLTINIPISHSEIETTGNNIIYVDDDNTMGPWDGSMDYPFQHVQEAINHAIDGDTIFVHNGKYPIKNLYCNKSIDLIGEDKKETIIKAEIPTHFGMISFNGSNMNIKNFTFQQSAVIIGDLSLNISEDRQGNVYFRNNIVKDIVVGLFVVSFSKQMSFQILDNIFIGEGSDSVGVICATNGTVLINDNNIEGYNMGILSTGKGLISGNHIIRSGYMGLTAFADSGGIQQSIISNNFMKNKRHASFFYDFSVQHEEEILSALSVNSEISNYFNKYFTSTPQRLSNNRLIEWRFNHWDNLKGFGPKMILGALSFQLPLRILSENKSVITLPWITMDWTPERHAYEVASHNYLSANVLGDIFEIYEGMDIPCQVFCGLDDIAGVKLQLNDETVLTDQNGEAMLTAPDIAGLYILSAEKEGYITDNTTILVNQEPSISFEKDINRKILKVTNHTPDYIDWHDILIEGDCDTSRIGNYVEAGDTISNCQGTISFRFIPTGNLLAEFTFE